MQNQIVKGRYSSDHAQYPDKQWYGLKSMLDDKTTTLGIGTDNVRDFLDWARFPVLTDGVNGEVWRDVGGAMKRFDEITPDTGRYYLRVNKAGTGFTKIPLGKNIIRGKFKSAFKRMGIMNWQKLRPHALRAWFTTILANDASVSLSETMAACRHKSVSASACYQKRSATSEANRMNSLFNALEPQDKDTKSDVTPEPVESTPVKTVESDVPSAVSTGNSTYESPEDNNQFSSFTQAQAEGLEDDLARVEAANGASHIGRTPVIHLYRVPPAEPSPRAFPVYESRSAYLRTLRPQRSPQVQNPYRSSTRSIRRRVPSLRELRIRSYRRRVQELERLTLLNSSPYRDDPDELYRDSLAHDMEERRRRSSDFHH